MKFEDRLKEAIGKRILLEYADGQSGTDFSTHGTLKAVEDDAIVIQGSLGEIILNRKVCYILHFEVF